MVRETSISCYYEIMEEGLIGERQKIVYDFLIEQDNFTDREIAFNLNYSDPNKIRPRRKELLDYGLIKDNGIRPCSISGKKAHTWIIELNPDLEKLREQKLKKRVKCNFCNGKGFINK